MSLETAQYDIKTLVRKLKDHLKTGKQITIDICNLIYAEGKCEKKDVAVEFYQRCRDEGITEDEIKNVLRFYVPSEYKDHKFDPLGVINHTLENLNPEALDPFSEDEYLDKQDTAGMNDIYDKIKYLKDRIEKNADGRHIPLVDHEPERAKKSTEKDKNPGYSDEYYVVDAGTADILECAELNDSVKDKIFANPSHRATVEQRADMVAKMQSFYQIVRTFNKFLRSCVDEKFSFTLWKHAEMMKNVETISKHGAAGKAGVQAMRDGVLTDEIRKMTRERAGDEAEEVLQWMKDMTDLMKNSAYWMGFVEWRDVYSTLNNRIAARKIDLSPEFSESAIG